MDTQYGQIIITDSKFALFEGKENPQIFSKFNLLDADTPLTLTLLWPLSVCINGV